MFFCSPRHEEVYIIAAPVHHYIKKKEPFMKHLIYYFTGTGNSLFVAKELAKAADAELLPATGVKKGNEITADTIGIVFPVYMFNAPHLIYSLVQQITSCSYCYIVVTMGGRPGHVTEKVAEQLSKKGCTLSASFYFVMPGNYIPWNGAITDSKQKEANSDAKEKVLQIAKIVQARTSHHDTKKTLRQDINYKIPFMFRFFPTPIGQFFCDMGFKYIPTMDASFTVSSSCNGCAICSKVCPVHNIIMTDDKPSWNHHCEQCLACLQWCPQMAIEYGKKSVGKKHYHHPDITVQEMMAQAGGK